MSLPALWCLVGKDVARPVRPTRVAGLKEGCGVSQQATQRRLDFFPIPVTPKAGAGSGREGQSESTGYPQMAGCCMARLVAGTMVASLSKAVVTWRGRSVVATARSWARRPRAHDWAWVMIHPSLKAATPNTVYDGKCPLNPAAINLLTGIPHFIRNILVHLEPQSGILPDPNQIANHDVNNPVPRIRLIRMLPEARLRRCHREPRPRLPPLLHKRNCRGRRLPMRGSGASTCSGNCR